MGNTPGTLLLLLNCCIPSRTVILYDDRATVLGSSYCIVYLVYVLPAICGPAVFKSHIFGFARLPGGYFCLRFLVAWTGSILSQFLHSGDLLGYICVIMCPCYCSGGWVNHPVVGWGVLFSFFLLVSSGSLPEWGRFGNFIGGLGDPGLVGVCMLCPALCF